MEELLIVEMVEHGNTLQFTSPAQGEAGCAGHSTGGSGGGGGGGATAGWSNPRK